MAAVVEQSGLLLALAPALAGSLILRLYRNDPPITQTNLFTDFDAATFPGYADVDLSGLLVGPSIDGLGRATIAAGPALFSRGPGPGSETIYGYVIFSVVGLTNKLRVAERFAAPRVVNTPGWALSISPAFFLQAF